MGVEGFGSRTEGFAEIYYRVLVLRVFGFGGGAYNMFLSSLFTIRVPFFLLFGFSKGALK